MLTYYYYYYLLLVLISQYFSFYSIVYFHIPASLLLRSSTVHNMFVMNNHLISLISFYFSENVMPLVEIRYLQYSIFSSKNELNTRVCTHMCMLLHSCMCVAIHVYSLLSLIVNVSLYCQVRECHYGWILD
jgi:hypothetical protein